MQIKHRPGQNFRRKLANRHVESGEAECGHAIWPEASFDADKDVLTSGRFIRGIVKNVHVPLDVDRRNRKFSSQANFKAIQEVLLSAALACDGTTLCSR